MSSDSVKRRSHFLRALNCGGGRGVCLLALLLSLFLPPADSRTLAQGRRKRPQPVTQAQNKKEEATDQLARTREEFRRATDEYKKSLAELIALYEKDVSRTEERLKQTRELYAQGLVSRKNLEESERAVADAKAKIDNARQQMTAADERVAETLVEAEAIEQMAKAPPAPKGKLIQATTYIRYMGTGAWSLSNAWQVQQFFQQKFGRPLPVSAFGQSSLHDRWGLDHRNAMDVGVNPGSVEGQALISFLRANGIPFAAFRAAIFGSATGPHIHIGLPSHRTKPLSSIR